jgi:NAD(P) transhydrogenase subunit alpha
MIVGIPKETFPGERRVAIVPASVPTLTKAGLEVVVQSGAGEAAGFSDAQYAERSARIASTREEVFAADVILQIRAAGANRASGTDDLPLLRAGQVLIGMCQPLGEPKLLSQFARRGLSIFALELLPRITRAQAMDVLSSMATVAGYRAVILAAAHLPKMFPMLMTAAGTISAAKVFVIGAGVAGLQAIATAKRLGAVVSAYDIRPAVKEQILSLGAKFVEMELDTSQAEAAGGYARAMDEDFYRKQRQLMAKVAAENDVVICTAAVPGKRAPLLLSAEAVRGMAPGSVIVDLAAESGGNCELSKPDQTVLDGGVTILAPTNPASEAPFDASQMYSRNVSTFLLAMVRNGQFTPDLDDQIVRETLVAREGQVVHPRVRELLDGSG